ncbi:hypothetical protein Tco_0485196 [Tanacetum coccineum]
MQNLRIRIPFHKHLLPNIDCTPPSKSRPSFPLIYYQNTQLASSSQTYTRFQQVIEHLVGEVLKIKRGEVVEPKDTRDAPGSVVDVEFKESIGFEVAKSDDAEGFDTGDEGFGCGFKVGDWVGWGGFE